MSFCRVGGDAVLCQSQDMENFWLILLGEEEKNVIFKITKESLNFRSYLWKMVVVPHHCRILHSRTEVAWEGQKAKDFPPCPE